MTTSKPMRDRAEVERALAHFEEMLTNPIPNGVTHELVLMAKRVREILLWVLEREGSTFGKLINELDEAKAEFLMHNHPGIQ